jgi:hypothetical protein
VYFIKRKGEEEEEEEEEEEYILCAILAIEISSSFLIKKI